MCDTSGRGKLTAHELKAILRAGGEDPDEEDLREIIYEIDRDSMIFIPLSLVSLKIIFTFI